MTVDRQESLKHFTREILQLMQLRSFDRHIHEKHFFFLMQIMSNFW